MNIIEQFAQKIDHLRSQIVLLRTHEVSEPISHHEILPAVLTELAATLEETYTIATRAAFLASVSDVLNSSMEWGTQLSQLAHAIVPFFADWCSIDIVEDDGTVRRLAVAHADPSKEPALQQLQRHFQVLQPGTIHTIWEVLRTRSPQLNVHFTDERLAAGARDEEHIRILRELGFSSEIVVPLIARQRLLGTITLVFGHSGRRYQTEDVALAVELADRAALNIDNARLYYQTRQTQYAAELEAVRMKSFYDVIAALTDATTPAGIFEVFINQGLPGLGAEAGVLTLLSDDQSTMELIGAHGYSKATLTRWQRFPVDTRMPLAESVTTGEAIWLESVEAISVRYPEFATLIAQSRYVSWVAIPLKANGQVLGGLWLSFGGRLPDNEADKSFILTLAAQFSRALLQASLYTPAKKQDS